MVLTRAVNIARPDRAGLLRRAIRRNRWRLLSGPAWVFLQMYVLKLGLLDPKFAILDETDSGLDIDALRIVGDGINRIMRAPDKAVILITHYQRLLDYVAPVFVHVL